MGRASNSHLFRNRFAISKREQIKKDIPNGGCKAHAFILED